jgi:putative spermidine/putrescine transport system ATP-binding protein
MRAVRATLLACLALSALAPLVLLLITSVGDRWFYPALLPPRITGESWRSLLGGGRLASATLTSMALATATGALACAVGLAIGRALAGLEGGWRHTAAAAAFLPVAAPPIALATGLQFTFLSLGLGGTFPGVLLAHAIPAAGYTSLYFLGLFQLLDPRIEDEARSLGASTTQLWRRVLLPMLRRPIAEGWVLGFLVSWAQVPLTLLVRGAHAAARDTRLRARWTGPLGRDGRIAPGPARPRGTAARTLRAAGRGGATLMGGGLRVAGLVAPFGATEGLTGVSFEVAPGERLVIVGASGAGKTTLLRSIAGLGTTAAGRIEIGGRDVTAEPPERRGVTYLHQTPLLFPHLSVAENVAFPLRVRRVPDSEIERRVAEALAAVRLEAFGARAPRTLSGGQRHRAALARAVVARPSALLLDEPLSSLDPRLREEVRDALVSLQRTYQPALVIVTHDLDEAGLVGDRIGVLLGGSVAQLATPAELFARPASLAVARFLGVANAVPGILHADGRFESPLGTLLIDDRTPWTGAAVAVFRPDALVAAADAPLEGRVEVLRHRSRETTALLRFRELLLEARVDAISPPAVGGTVRFSLRSSAVTVLPSD